MRLHVLVAAAASLIGIADVARAQNAPPPVAPGTKVRVWSPELPRSGAVTMLIEWGADSLELLPPDRRRRAMPSEAERPTWKVSRRSITRLQVFTRISRGEGARLGAVYFGATGAAVGLVAGALVGGMGGQFYPRGTDQPGVSPVLVAVPAGAALGGAYGALMGAVFLRSTWRRVPLEALAPANTESRGPEQP